MTGWAACRGKIVRPDVDTLARPVADVFPRSAELVRRAEEHRSAVALADAVRTFVRHGTTGHYEAMTVALARFDATLEQ